MPVGRSVSVIALLLHLLLLPLLDFTDPALVGLTWMSCWPKISPMKTFLRLLHVPVAKVGWWIPSSLSVFSPHSLPHCLDHKKGGREVWWLTYFAYHSHCHLITLTYFLLIPFLVWSLSSLPSPSTLASSFFSADDAHWYERGEPHCICKATGQCYVPWGNYNA